MRGGGSRESQEKRCQATEPRTLGYSHLIPRNGIGITGPNQWVSYRMCSRGRLHLLILPAVAQPVAEKVIQRFDGVDLTDCGLDIVDDASKRDLRAIKQDVTRSRIPIARLAYSPDVAN